MVRSTGRRQRAEAGAGRDGDLAAALRRAAEALIVERGPQGFSLREVARRARVSEAAPYWHFANKEALLAAVAEAQRAGRARRGDTEEMAVAAWSLMHGLSALLIDRQLARRVTTARDAEILAGRLTRLLQTGLAPRPTKA